MHASSVAVHGSRNPHRFTDLLTPDTPISASDLYSCHKIEAENIVRSSDLEWSILRLGGVITLDPLVEYRDFDSFYFGALLPEDNRDHTVDCRDVAAAFSAAITTDVVREVFMIAGDDSHKRLQGEVGLASAAAMGLGALMFTSRPGNPDNDGDWYPLDWMDTAVRSRCCPFNGTPARIRMPRFAPESASRPLRAVAPVMGTLMRRRSPYYKMPVPTPVPDSPV